MSILDGKHVNCAISRAGSEGKASWCRENIERDIERERRQAEDADLMEDDADPVPCITRAHFEEAMKYARRSVSDADIRKYQVPTQSAQCSRSPLRLAIGKFGLMRASAGHCVWWTYRKSM